MKHLLVLAAACCCLAGITANAQKIRLRSRITPNCGVSTTLKFADIYADGNIAVMGSYNCRGAFIFDVSNPDAPVLSSWYNPGANQQFLEAIVVGNRGYFGSGNGGGVYIVDLTVPSSPQLLGIVNASNNAFNSIHEMMVFQQNGATYLLENFNGFGNKLLKIINVTNPAAPVFIRDINPTELNWVHAFHIRGNRLFTSGWGSSAAKGRTEIYDITNIGTQAPQLLGFVEDPNASLTNGNNMHSSWTSEDGHYLYSAREITNSNGASPGDVRVYDVTDPAVPLLVDRLSMSDLELNAVTPHNPVVMGNKLYVSWYQAGLQVFDISTPDKPQRLGQYDTFERTFMPRAKGDSDLAEEPWDVICGRDGLQNTLPTSYDGAWAVFPFLGEDRVLVGDLDTGLYILDVSHATGPAKNVVSDFDGDGKTDLSVYTPSNGNWSYVMSSDGGSGSDLWGAPTDTIVSGDYDGDGKADKAVFRPSDGYWYIRSSSGQEMYVRWGASTDIPVPGDYDADGKTDIAVFRPSDGGWYILQSTLGMKFAHWGLSTDLPVAGDYDGDGKTDIAVFRPSVGGWYILNSSSNIPTFATFGGPGDQPLVGDFSGDGRIDIAVFRPSNGLWCIYDLATSQQTYQLWGASDDIPVPADYDGDGKADIGVFRPADGYWYMISSSTGGFDFRPFGHIGDLPSPASVNP